MEMYHWTRNLQRREWSECKVLQRSGEWGWWRADSKYGMSVKPERRLRHLITYAVEAG